VAWKRPAAPPDLSSGANCVVARAVAVRAGRQRRLQRSIIYNLLPETYDVKNAFYTGSIPMVGFGAGAYAVALWDYYGK
jgi:hypothetical protein